MSRTFITRLEALQLINSLLEKYDFEEAEIEGLEDIKHCIDVEREYFHEWGADGGETVYLHLPTNSAIVQSLEDEELIRIYKKYRYRPSEFDKEESKKQIDAMKETLKKMGLL